MADHRQDYSPAKLYANGRRMVDDYSAEDAVADYLRLHPQADERLVRDEISQAAA